MRKREKTVAKGALIGFVGVSLIDVLVQWMEHMDRGEKFTWDSYNGKRTLRNGLLGGAVGAGLGYAYYEFQSSLEQKQSFNSDEYLNVVLRTENLKENPVLLNNAISVRDKLKFWAVDNFSDKLISLPENTGSFVKRTANANSFDIDVLLPFRKNSFNTLEEMYEWTFEKLYDKFGDQVKIDRGTKAISMTFEKNGHAINFDVVPGREIGNYTKDRRLNLYVNPKRVWKRGSSFKIDVSTQRNITVNKPKARRVIRLLKIYNESNYLEIPSVIIEQAVVEALSENRYGTYYSDTANLLNSMEYLTEKLDQVKYIDIGNTNNNLNDKIDPFSKLSVIDLLSKDVDKIKANPHYLKEVFEMNYDE